jgi:hypothetical protein
MLEVEERKRKTENELKRKRERESVENGREGTNGGRLMVARGAAPRAFNIFEPIAY